MFISFLLYYLVKTTFERLTMLDLYLYYLLKKVLKKTGHTSGLDIESNADRQIFRQTIGKTKRQTIRQYTQKITFARKFNPCFLFF